MSKTDLKKSVVDLSEYVKRLRNDPRTCISMNGVIVALERLVEVERASIELLEGKK